MNRYLAQEKRVFDISKFTVVGNPTISDDGVASGFSNANYLKITNKIDINSKELDIVLVNNIAYYTSGIANPIFAMYNSVLNRFGILFSSPDSTKVSLLLRNPIDNSNIINVSNINVSSITGANLLGTHKYRLYLNKKTEKVIIYVDNNEVFNETVDLTNLSFENNLISLGYIGLTAGQTLNGSIDLTKFSITVDGKTVFTGTKPVHLLERRKEGFDLSKFTVVGTPTITEYGVASGFSPQNYIKSNYTLEENKTYTFEIEGVGGSPRTDRGSYILAVYYNSGTSDNLRIITGANNGGVRFSLGSYSDVGLPFEIVENTKYKIQVITDFKSFVTFNELIMGYTLTKTGYEITNQNYGENIINYGTANTVAPLTNGVINLPSFSITVDGKEVFTGAKENYYVLRS